jgi:hypothetical protein
LGFLSFGVASDQRPAASALAAGIAWAHPTGKDASIVRFVLPIGENASFHPEGSFAVASLAVLAFFWFEIAKMLKDQDRCPMRLCKLDNATTDQMCELLIGMVHFLPQVSIVLLTFCNLASARAGACNTTEKTLPKAGYPLSTPNEEGRKSRTFAISNRADS